MSDVRADLLLIGDAYEHDGGNNLTHRYVVNSVDVGRDVVVDRAEIDTHYD